MNKTTVIPLSKTKITWLLFASVLFLLLGALFVLNPETFARGSLRSPDIVRIIGIVSIAFFGLCLVFLVRKVFDKKAGLIIGPEGITDNSSATSAGLIEWEDITGIERLQIASTKILMIFTDKPEKYIDRARGRIAKRAMKANYKMYGSPLSIVSNSLKIKFKDLEGLISSELDKRRGQRRSSSL